MAVRRVIDYIYAGDVFQVNLAQRLLTPAQSDAVSLYRRLRRCNPAPMAGYFDLGDFQIVSASPERFLRLSGGSVETRPIKGTRRRTGRPDADRAAEAELLASEKDRAENVMIVDLLRNDLSRVCTPDSVQVTPALRPRKVRVCRASCLGRLRAFARRMLARWTCSAQRFPADRSPVRRRSARWRSSPSWSQRPGAPTAARWAIWASTAPWT